MSQPQGSRRSDRYASQGARGGSGKKKKPLPLAAVLALDLLGGGILLCIFALFDHVIVFDSNPPAPVTLPTATITATATIEPTPDITPEPVQTEDGDPQDTPEPTVPPKVFDGMWGEKFADKFVEGEPVSTENSYVSEHMNIQCETVRADGVTYHVADIYLSDIKYLRSAFASDKNGAGTAFVDEIGREHDAVVAITGDHYNGRHEGIVIRNGQLYRESRFQDVCILREDGVMETFHNKDFDLEKIKAEGGVLQAWSFGPLLIENGAPIESYSSDVTTVAGANPRSAIGYVEPGHYIFIMVDGRGGNDSKGVTMGELAHMFADRGCVAAYNFDGGQTAGMAWQGEMVSHPYGRKVADIVYITDNPPE